MDQLETWRKAEMAFKKHGGMLRTFRALALGIHPRVLYGLRDAGRLRQVSRGLYRLAELPELGNPDLAAVASRVPQGVICLISALAFHEITTQIPHQIDVAVPRGTKQPRLDFPPIRIFRFSSPMHQAGVEVHRMDGVEVRVYNAAKTIADCFRFRNRIGIDVAAEALRFFHSRKKAPMRELLEYARLCRVERVMKPYIEALL
ncbi:MAG TPA: type IV toxin-antitoxin system AbiEi family antitoxin domain-containing protein [Burkholderiaceae bacterium]|jgi:predicted transcriptional regulator of viral defense system|nr:type IV toxin-antitoxin system AbiEi family antitoxin domain-containing protein [Burkholderiaceae bacterium]